MSKFVYHQKIKSMKYLIIMLISTSILIACSETLDDLKTPVVSTEVPEEALHIAFGDLMTLSGPSYFEDFEGVKFSVLEGSFVCEDDYPNMNFQKVIISNQAEYNGSVTDAQEKELHLSDGNYSLIENVDVSVQQRHCYTETHYDVDRCPYGGKRLCWIKITYCREPWELNYRQTSVERSCQSCNDGPVILDTPMCLNN